jgi:SAM-dependent methyltransferase
MQQADLGFQANLYESANPTRRWLHQCRRDWLTGKLAEHAQPHQRFLEVGIGCGIYTRHLSALGQVVALDINPDFVAAAKQLPNTEARIADVQQLEYQAEFDLALCSEVIEHIPDSQRALANLYRSLRPGGILLLTTPNRYSTVELTARLLSLPGVAAMARRIYGEPVDDLGHINRLTQGALREQLTRAGFVIEEQQNLAFYLPIVGEFGGGPAQRLLAAIARRLQNSKRLTWLLWTQCWVCRRPA